MLLYLLAITCGVMADDNLDSVTLDLTVVKKTMSVDCGEPRELITVVGDVQDTAFNQGRRNGFPAPEIRVRQGGVVVVTITNLMNHPTSFHWHGLTQKTQPQVDGVGFVTACPIFPGETKTIRFTVEDQPGTYYYHDHSSPSMADGIVGPLTVVPSNTRDILWEQETYDFDQIVMLQDFFNISAFEFAEWFNTGPGFNPNYVDGGCAKGEKEKELAFGPFSYLWNGRTLPYSEYAKNPQISHLNNANHRRGTDDESCGYPFIEMEPGKRYRMRFIGAGTLNELKISYPGMTIIGADNSRTVPLVTDSFEFMPGQRYDVLITAPEKPTWINLENMGFDNIPPSRLLIGPKNTTAASALVLNDIWPAPTGFPAATSDFEGGFQSQLEPAERALFWWPPASIAGPPENSYHVQIGFGEYVTPDDFETVADFGPGVPWFSINNIANRYETMPQPTCSKAYNLLDSAVQDSTMNGTPLRRNSGGTVDVNKAAAALVERQRVAEEVRSRKQSGRTERSTGELGTLIYNVEWGTTTQIILEGTGVHPFHLHGHDFHVVAICEGSFSSYAENTQTVTATKEVGGNTTSYECPLNLINPLPRDTIVKNAGKFVVLRYHSRNPGTWIFHCHIEWHLLKGMGMFFNTKPNPKEVNVGDYGSGYFANLNSPELCGVECKAPGSCEGRCGEYGTNDLICSCSSRCATFGTCCEDYDQFCQLQLPNVSGLSVEVAPHESGTDIKVHWDAPEEESYYLVVCDNGVDTALETVVMEPVAHFIGNNPPGLFECSVRATNNAGSTTEILPKRVVVGCNALCENMENCDIDTGMCRDQCGSECCDPAVSCNNKAVTTCVCKFDPYCCDAVWDLQCVEEAKDGCGFCKN